MPSPDPSAASGPDGSGATDDPLAETYRQHYGFVWRSLHRLGVADHGVDDAVHDVFVVAARRLHEFEGRAAVTSWLFAVAVNVAAHQRRNLARHQRRQDALAREVDAAGAPYGRPKDAYAQHDAIQVLHGLLEHLDEPRRHVFILMELEQMTGREVADMLGIKVATVHSRLRSARDQVRRAAAELSPEAIRRSA